MTTKPSPSLTPMRLMLMLEDAQREGRVEHDVFTELSEDYEAHYGERSPLPRARADAASWEAMVLEQMAGVKAGTCSREVLKSSAYCLKMAQSELARLETDAGRVKRELWAALVLAAAWVVEPGEDSEPLPTSAQA